MKKQYNTTGSCMAKLAASLWMCLIAASAINAESRPNIIFLYADDLGWGDVGAYGNPRIQTPNMDRLAREGRIFTSGYASGSVCSPSRASVLTGLFPARTGIHGHFAPGGRNAERGMPDSLPLEFPTFTRLLQDAGYRTAHFGKWHLGDIDAVRYGFDEAITANGGGTNMYDLPDGYFHFFRESSERFTDDAIDFIRRNKQEPFYVQLWYLEPHAPNLPLDHSLKKYRMPSAPFSQEWVIPEPLIAYQAVVTNMDYHIGRLMDELDRLGLSDNTLIILSSDNGPEDHHISNRANTLGMGDPGPFRGRKRSLYEGGIRVPFIARWPGQVPAGTVDDDNPVASVDLFATFAGLAGAEDIPDNLDGVDITPALLGQVFERSKPLFWEWRYGIAGYKINVSPTHAVREGPWKLLMNFDESRIELYHLDEDPMEVDNRVATDAETAERLRKKIMQWRATIPEWLGDRWAGDNRYPWPGR
jgi:arylsulfatase A-like enzyme